MRRTEFGASSSPSEKNTTYNATCRFDCFRWADPCIRALASLLHILPAETLACNLCLAVRLCRKRWISDGLRLCLQFTSRILALQVQVPFPYRPAASPRMAKFTISCPSRNRATVANGSPTERLIHDATPAFCRAFQSKTYNFNLVLQTAQHDLSLTASNSSHLRSPRTFETTLGVVLGAEVNHLD